MSTDLSTWRATAVGELLAQRNADGGWPYRGGLASATEPTALAALVLAEAGGHDDLLAVAGDWLVARQRGGGLISASPAHQDGSWLTPLAAMTLSRAGQSQAAAGAAQALLAEPAYSLGQSPPNIYGYNTGLIGWPWMPGTFSFVEPTALAVLFLKQSGLTDHVRVRAGVELIFNRALAAGGWNYGEPEVLGGQLFPADAPTAMVLLALADEQNMATAAALAWLLSRRGQITSLYSLGWVACALNVLSVLDTAWQDEVVATWTALPAARRDAVGTALCWLGLSEASGHPFALS